MHHLYLFAYALKLLLKKLRKKSSALFNALPNGAFVPPVTPAASLGESNNHFQPATALPPITKKSTECAKITSFYFLLNDKCLFTFFLVPVPFSAAFSVCIFFSWIADEVSTTSKPEITELKLFHPARAT